MLLLMTVILGALEFVLRICRTTPFSMTLNDSSPRLRRYAILWRWISQKELKIPPSCYKMWIGNRILS